MKFLLPFIFIIVAAFASPSVRIIGGRDANAGEFPFAVAITVQKNEGLYFCGGALLSNSWILTAGSCVDGGLVFSIRLGSPELDSSSAVRVTTNKYVLHPDYDPATLFNDIGLIELRIPIELTDYIQPTGLPIRDLQPYALVTSIGWGQISDEDSGIVNTLQAVQITALSNEECRKDFGYQISDEMVCAEGNYNQGICLGDTGGPLIQYVNGHQDTVVGVASFISSNGCETTDPSGFTRTYPYLDWLKNITGIA